MIRVFRIQTPDFTPQNAPQSAISSKNNNFFVVIESMWAWVSEKSCILFEKNEKKVLTT